MGKPTVEDNGPPEEEDRRRRPRGPKYPIESSPLIALDRLTLRDRKLLATMIGRYGADAIADAAKIIGHGNHVRGEDDRRSRRICAP